MLGLLAVTGLRLGEVLSLRVEDIDWSEGLLRIGEAKFLKSRLVPLHPSTLNQLRAYKKRRDEFFAERVADPVSRFFVTCHGNPVRRSQVGRGLPWSIQKDWFARAWFTPWPADPRSATPFRHCDPTALVPKRRAS
jgi:integrase